MILTEVRKPTCKNPKCKFCEQDRAPKLDLRGKVNRALAELKSTWLMCWKQAGGEK